MKSSLKIQGNLNNKIVSSKLMKLDDVPKNARKKLIKQIKNDDNYDGEYDDEKYYSDDECDSVFSIKLTSVMLELLENKKNFDRSFEKLFNIVKECSVEDNKQFQPLTKDDKKNMEQMMGCNSE
jgi:hypothetical protein